MSTNSTKNIHIFLISSFSTHFSFQFVEIQMMQPDFKMGLKVVQCQKGDSETGFILKRTFDGMKSESMLMTVTIIIKKSKAYLRI